MHRVHCARPERPEQLQDTDAVRLVGRFCSFRASHLAAALSLVVQAFPSAVAAQAMPVSATVVRVIDGDTVDVQLPTTHRIAGLVTGDVRIGQVTGSWGLFELFRAG